MVAGMLVKVYIILTHAHYMRIPCNRRRSQPPVITTIFRRFIPASQYSPYFRNVAPQFYKNRNFHRDPNFAKPDVSPQLLAEEPGLGIVGPPIGTVGPGLGSVRPSLDSLRPKLGSAGPGLGILGPGVGTEEPGLGSVGQGLGKVESGLAAAKKIEEDAKTLRCAQLLCPAEELGPPVCACNYQTGKVATFTDMCDVKRHNCRYDTVFKVIINAICPWDFKTRRTIGKPFIDYSDSKYYN